MRSLQRKVKGLAGRATIGNALTSNTNLAARTAAILAKYSPLSHQYDFTDMSALFQDSAGTTPVTAVEQPIGKVLDKSGNGAHAIQATSTKRPTLSARYNQLQNSNNLTLTGWITTDFGGTGSQALVTQNYATAPNGTITASRVVLALNGGSTTSDKSTINQAAIVPNNAGIKFGFWLKTTDGSTKLVKFRDEVGTSINTVLTVNPDWTYYPLTGTVVGVNCNFKLWLRGAEGTSDSADILVAFCDVRTVTGVPLTIPSYQWVTNSTTYDTVGFPTYAKFDGIDDALVTSSIDFTSTSAVSCFTGLTKLSDATGAVCYEFGASVAATNGSFALFAPSNLATPDYAVASRGTITVTPTYPSSYAAPNTSVITAITNITTPLITGKLNGSSVTTSSSSQGTGNYSNSPLYIGARAGTLIPYTGNISTISLVGATLTAQEILTLEAFANNKLGKVY
jgi:hypothetical protein